MTTTSREAHELDFEQFTARVEVGDEGGVWVNLLDPSGYILTLHWEDLEELYDFTRRHGFPNNGD